MNLAELLSWSGLDVLDHLEREVAVPVVDGLQAQGDLIVIPLDMLGAILLWGSGRWQPVPPSGVELVRGEGGNNPHTLVADVGTCHWTNGFRDATGLAIAVVDNTAPAYLVHPEHGGSGIAPGRWLVRRQQERGVGLRGAVLVAD
ncbi:hypothetical protein [Kutzneria sp. NPDC052558]|uniref:hypothetical protein n=1 Tax=Kutzneria sp. NPDC052558 TaxID=3364121 RepID=UPI0037C725BE